MSLIQFMDKEYMYNKLIEVANGYNDLAKTNENVVTGYRRIIENKEYNSEQIAPLIDIYDGLTAKFTMLSEKTLLAAQNFAK